MTFKLGAACETGIIVAVAMAYSSSENIIRFREMKNLGSRKFENYSMQYVLGVQYVI